jgi:hypothetical protein
MPKVSRGFQKLIKDYQFWQKSLSLSPGAIVIQTDEVASKLASFYESIRKVVDWKEQHLMRRVAIERILKRRLLLRTKGQQIAEPFVLELVRGGYFPSTPIEKQKIAVIQKALDKYIFILDHLKKIDLKDKNQGEVYTDILGIAACEIEEVLAPNFYLKQNALIRFAEGVMRGRIKVGSRARELTQITDEEIKIQIYISLQQSLFKLDEPIISYNLIKRYYPFWPHPTSEQIKAFTERLGQVLEDIETQFNHPLANKFYKIMERYNTPYLLLDDILSEDPQLFSSDKIKEPSDLNHYVSRAYAARLKTLRSRLRRAAFYSTLSIFLTNVFTLYVLEFPFAKYVMGNIHPLAAVIDVLAPTFLMLILVSTVKTPPAANKKIVLKEVQKIVYEGTEKVSYEVEVYRKGNFIFRLVNNLIYGISFAACFGLIVFALYKLNYPPLSYLLLIMFTSLIAFTGNKIRKSSRELHMNEKRDSFFQVIIDLFSVPVMSLGKWFLARWKKINILGVFFNVLIDTPFLIFAQFLEQWRYFLKEKKENLR